MPAASKPSAATATTAQDAGPPSPAGAPLPVDLRRLQLPKIDLARPAGTQIFTALKAAILRLDLPPGCALSEAELGARFGASRTPVREALAQLRDAGLVVTYPSRGNFVTKLDAEKIREARYLREALEVANVARIVETGMSPAVEADLTACLVRQQEAIDAGNAEAFRAEDDLFHQRLALATGHARVAHVLAHEKMQIDRLRMIGRRDHDHLDTLHIQHCQIFDALKQRDMKLAISTTQAHLRAVLLVLAELTESHPEYFS